MDISKLILTDAALDIVDNGIWVGDLSGAPGVELMVTGMDRCDAVSKEIRRGVELEIARGSDREEAAEITVRRLLSSHILKDWRGLTDGGKPLPYSRELADKFLSTRKGDALAALVIEAARRVDREANEMAAEIEKNSSAG